MCVMSRAALSRYPNACSRARLLSCLRRLLVRLSVGSISCRLRRPLTRSLARRLVFLLAHSLVRLLAWLACSRVGQFSCLLTESFAPASFFYHSCDEKKKNAPCVSGGAPRLSVRPPGIERSRVCAELCGPSALVPPFRRYHVSFVETCEGLFFQFGFRRLGNHNDSPIKC